MEPKRIVVLGGGFAGLWSALGAARKLDELGVGPEAVEVCVVNSDAYHSLRVRNYEQDLTPARIPLDEVLKPAGIRRLEGQVTHLSPDEQSVTITAPPDSRTLSYDRLIFALGSRLARPEIPGIQQYAFDVDTYDGAARLEAHLQALPDRPETPGKFTVLVVGAGLTGIEAAAEMPARLQTIQERTGLSPAYRVVLADHQPHIGSDMEEEARPIIEEALAALGVETQTGVQITEVSPSGVRLASGETLAAETVIWCAGMQANPLTAHFPVERDRFGRLPVDAYLKVKGVPNVYAAWMQMDADHTSVMSCQHSRPMGRFAGHNVVCNLFDLPPLPLQIAWYVTVLDLGAWGALYTEGWDRHVVATGAEAKRTKRVINGERIYPPRNGDHRAILDAAAPVVQAPPSTLRKADVPPAH